MSINEKINNCNDFKSLGLLIKGANVVGTLDGKKVLVQKDKQILDFEKIKEKFDELTKTQQPSENSEKVQRKIKRLEKEIERHQKVRKLSDVSLSSTSPEASGKSSTESSPKATVQELDPPEMLKSLSLHSSEDIDKMARSEEVTVKSLSADPDQVTSMRIALKRFENLFEELRSRKPSDNNADLIVKIKELYNYLKAANYDVLMQNWKSRLEEHGFTFLS